MNRRKLLKRLKELGFILKEGGNHTKVFDRDGRYKSCVARHVEIAEKVVREIEKQLNVKL